MQLPWGGGVTVIASSAGSARKAFHIARSADIAILRAAESRRSPPISATKRESGI